MTLSLDTNAIIDVARGRSEARSRFQDAAAAGVPMVVSVVVWHELRFGVLICSRPAQELARIEEVLTGLARVDFDLADADAAAVVRAELRRNRQGIGSYDALIAGQALAKGWTVVTANTREFARIKGLSVVDWTRSEEQ